MGKLRSAESPCSSWFGCSRGSGGTPAPFPAASQQLLTERRLFPAVYRSPHMLLQPGLGLKVAAER